MGVPQFLPLSLVDLSRELAQIAGRDARFERAAALAAELEVELARLTRNTSAHPIRRRRTRVSRTPRSPRTAERLLAFQAEVHARATTCERIDEQGVLISTQQLSDLRLGERTRRIFADAGLLHVQDVTSMAAERAVNIPRLAPASVAEVRAAIMFALEAVGEKRKPMLSAFSTVERDSYPELDVSKRVQILGPAVQADDGSFRLPDAPTPGLDDRHIRALNGLIGVLQRLGSSRISSLTNEVNRRLPRAYHVNEQYVRTWLTSHPELFTQADPDRFKLASLDVDILCGLATSFLPGDSSPAVAAGCPANLAVERLRERVAAEITDFLRREGPQRIDRIRSHLYGRFIGLGSADVVIAQSPHRFARQPTGLISVRDTDEALDGEPIDLGAPFTGRRRSHFGQQR